MPDLIRPTSCQMKQQNNSLRDFTDWPTTANSANWNPRWSTIVWLSGFKTKIYPTPAVWDRPNFAEDREFNLTASSSARAAAYPGILDDCHPHMAIGWTSLDHRSQSLWDHLILSQTGIHQMQEMWKRILSPTTMSSPRIHLSLIQAQRTLCLTVPF